MATATYTGKLTDFGESPFPGAVPKLWVEAEKPGVGPSGPLATRRIPVTVASNGNFTVALVPSVLVQPVAKYVLRLEWVNTSGVMQGTSDWLFTARPGGGHIRDMIDTPILPWVIAYGYGPPPSGITTGIYIDISGVNPVLYAPPGGGY